MPARERKIGRIVNERQRVQMDDVGVPALVLAMACIALHAIDTGHPAVKPAAVAYVSRDVFVARDTELRLTLAVGPIVTLLAVLLEFRMCGDDLARHQQRLDIGGQA
jgi:uncharacterized membrane protein YGL010W